MCSWQVDGHVITDKDLQLLNQQLISFASEIEQRKSGDCQAPSKVLAQLPTFIDVNFPQGDAIPVIYASDGSYVNAMAIQAEKSFSFSKIDLASVGSCRDYIFRSGVQVHDLISMMSAKHTGAILNSGQMLSSHYSTTVVGRVENPPMGYSNYDHSKHAKADLVIKCEKGIWILDPVLSKCTAM